MDYMNQGNPLDRGYDYCEHCGCVVDWKRNTDSNLVTIFDIEHNKEKCVCGDCEWEIEENNEVIRNIEKEMEK